MISNDLPLKYTIQNIEWLKDSFGDYWRAELLCNGKRVGLTGSYYSLDETGNARLSREEQEANLSNELIAGFGVQQ